MSEYQQVKLFLDHDKIGLHFSAALVNSSNRYTDESLLYKGYKDINEWLQGTGKSVKKSFRQHP